MPCVLPLIQDFFRPRLVSLAATFSYSYWTIGIWARAPAPACDRKRHARPRVNAHLQRPGLSWWRTFGVRSYRLLIRTNHGCIAIAIRPPITATAPAKSEGRFDDATSGSDSDCKNSCSYDVGHTGHQHRAACHAAATPATTSGSS